MADNVLRRYIFASDFDQTLTFNDSGYVLAELVGISTEEFERKSKGMAKINLVQQGAELAYLLLHDPEFRAKVRKEHLREVGKRIRLKSDIKLLYQLLDAGIDGHQFDFYVLSAAPVEIVRSALEDIVPPITFMERNSATSRQARSTRLSGRRRDMGRWRCSTVCCCSVWLDRITWCTPEMAARTFMSCCTSMHATG